MKLTEYKIKEFAKIEAGGTPSTKNPSYWEGNISWITPNDLTSYEKMYISKGERNITTEGLKNSSAKLLPPKTVLLTTRAPVGYVALAGTEVSTNQGFKNLICDQTKADPEFVYYLLKKNKSLLQAHATGSTFVELSGSRISNIKLNLPDLNIQKNIALILISYDNLIDTNRRRIQLLEEAARLLFREWFVYFRFPGHEKVKIVDGMPEGWEKEKLIKIGYLNYGKALVEETREEGDVKVYGSSGVVGVHSKSLVQGPGIIVGRKGNVGAIHWVNDSYWPIDTVYYIKKEQSNLFLYLSLKTIGFINTDASVPGLNRDYAHSKMILVPTKDLLDKFLNQVNDIYSMVKVLNTQNQKLAQARDLLLPWLMSGAIEV